MDSFLRTKRLKRVKNHVALSLQRLCCAHTGKRRRKNIRLMSLCGGTNLFLNCSGSQENVALACEPGPHKHKHHYPFQLIQSGEKHVCAIINFSLRGDLRCFWYVKFWFAISNLETFILPLSLQ